MCGRGRCGRSVEPDDGALVADPAFPGRARPPNSTLTRLRIGRGQPRRPRGWSWKVEALPARERGRRASGCPRIRASRRQRTQAACKLRTSADQDELWGWYRRRHRATRRRHARDAHPRAKPVRAGQGCGALWRVQRQGDRAVRCFRPPSRHTRPSSLRPPGRTKVKIRDRAGGRRMLRLGWWVGPSSRDRTESWVQT